MPRALPIIAALLLAVTLVTPAVAEERIIGGVRYSVSEVPWTMSLRKDKTHICGAVLITKNKALTAAHCVDHKTVKSLSVRAGSSDRTNGGVTAAVNTYVKHPNYNPATGDYDIALVYLATSLKLSGTITPVDITAATPALNTEVTVVGWGELKKNGKDPRLLRGTRFRTVSTAACQPGHLRTITPRMLCAGLPSGAKDACHGDSGGPLTTNRDILVGLVSFGEPCTYPTVAGAYGVYVNLGQATIRQWIHQLANI
ncbi:S1 family serine peptidase [Actinokineospora globicatena]|uniref:Serine protease n=1 Tax=Actinokineospora globicatena TaxID=103729 RepID=A0A9W6V752_9PSEU|nr:serine protease [Actinokineospora globicatena]GLW89629.1 serine protease [Actinokineospora globicatena]